MLSVLSGFLMGLTLIIAIGAQNAFVLRQGLRRSHLGLVVATCAVSDAVLIVAGVAGLGHLLEVFPWFAEAARWGGAAFLLVYGVHAARRALDPPAEGLQVEETVPGPTAGAGAVATRAVPTRTEQTCTGLTRTGLTRTGLTRTGLIRTGAAPVVATALALTWLNPHVYLDTVVLLGSVAATHGDHRWWFALGAVTASIVWFCALGYGARYLGRWLRGARAWQVLDGVIAAVMLALAVTLVVA
ncbi:LysE/ArgO family amino acid transporter [Aeromicrobium sp. CTD01-1L150]|uniref:LysE/ArgO family amino acid transporter n=1 Tax=Aeromicrobium sp. CTD01-1L150 TaxID=3341830 RepID=UPI0035BECC14